jgi:type III restriction enzyme
MTVVLGIEGFKHDGTKAKHTAANRWVDAMNNWGQLRRWAFHVCRNPQLLDKEMKYLSRRESVRSNPDRTFRREP